MLRRLLPRALVIAFALAAGPAGALAQAPVAEAVPQSREAVRQTFAPIVRLAAPAVVNSYSWVSLTPRVEGFAGAVLVVTLSYYPLVYLPAAAAVRRRSRRAGCWSRCRAPMW